VSQPIAERGWLPKAAIPELGAEGLSMIHAGRREVRSRAEADGRVTQGCIRPSAEILD